MNDYDYWRAKLAGEDPDPPADRTLLPLGFWRLRNGEPLAVWIREDGERVAASGFASRPRPWSRQRMESTAESGSFGQAVTEEVWRAAYEAGHWPDDPPPVAAGHNLPGDPLERIAAELRDEAEMTAAFLSSPVATQADADKCSTWARRVGLLAKKADEARKAEKEPHLAASRAVDDRWRAVIAEAETLTATLKKHVEPFLIAEKRKADEAARVAREQAETLRRQAMESDQKSAAERDALRAKATEVEKAAEPKRPIAGRPNMRVSLRKKVRARIVDYDACYAALKEHPDMREYVTDLANRAVRAGVPLAGVEAETYEEAA